MILRLKKNQTIVHIITTMHCNRGQAGEEFLYDTLQKRPLARFVERPYSEVEYHRPYDYFVDYKNDETACPL
jgi:hypothetical protein